MFRFQYNKFMREYSILKYMRAHKKIDLPKDFAERILVNEIKFKLADKLMSEILCNLIELY